MWISHINWKRGFWRIYLVISILFLGYFFILSLSNAITNKDEIFDCKDHRVLNYDECKVLEKIWLSEQNHCVKVESIFVNPDDCSLKINSHKFTGYSVERPIERVIIVFVNDFFKPFLFWLFVTVAIFLCIWIAKGFLKNE